MFSGYYYPYYRSFVNSYYQPVGFPGYGYNSNNYSSNIIGSAVVDQNMNVIGAGAVGGNQVATPTVVW